MQRSDQILNINQKRSEYNVHTETYCLSRESRPIKNGKTKKLSETEGFVETKRERESGNQDVLN